MSVIFTEDFEGGRTLAQIFDNAVGSTVSFDTARFHGGAQAIKFHQTGSASASKRNLPAGTHELVCRVWVNLDANPSAAWQLFNCDAGAGGGIARIATTGKLQIGCAGGTFQTAGAAIPLDTWTAIDFKFVTTGTTWTVDAKVAGTSITQATLGGQTANTDITTVKFFSSGAITDDCWCDDFKIATAAADYPLSDSASYTINLGNISSPKAVRGLSLTDAMPTYGVGRISSPKAVRGLSLPIAATLGLGHIDSRQNTAKCWLGVSNQTLGGQDLDAVEELIGRPFVGLRQNQGIATTGWTGADGYYDDSGYFLTYRDIQADGAGDWAAVAAGTYDSNLTDIFTNLMADGRWGPLNPAYICFTHETSISADVLGGVAGTAQEYIDAWRYVRLFADAMGASMYDVNGNYLGGPIIWCYVGWDRMFVGSGGVGGPTAGQGIDDFDPDLGSSPAPAGTSYYELIGSDVYNDITAGALKYGTDAATLLQPIYDAALARGKDWMIGEWACADGATTQSHQDKADWLDSFRTFITGIGDGPSRCVFALSTVKISSSNYPPDSSTEALAAWRTLALDPYFAGGLGPTTYGLDVQTDSTLSLGKISSPAANRGLALTAALPTYSVGKVSSPKAVRGASLSLSPTVSLGKIASPAALRGFGVGINYTVSLGKVASPKALHGVSAQVAATLSIGHLTTHTALHGLAISGVVRPPLITVPCYDGNVAVSVYAPFRNVPVFPVLHTLEIT